MGSEYLLYFETSLMTPGDLCRVQSARTYLMDQVIHHCWKKWKIEGVCIMELSELSV